MKKSSSISTNLNFNPPLILMIELPEVIKRIAHLASNLLSLVSTINRWNNIIIHINIQFIFHIVMSVVLNKIYSVLSIYRPRILRFLVFTVRHLRSRIKSHINNVIFSRIRFPRSPLKKTVPTQHFSYKFFRIDRSIEKKNFEARY
jgi:hypothetical protein